MLAVLLDDLTHTKLVDALLDGAVVVALGLGKVPRAVLALQAGKWGMRVRDTESPAEALRWTGEGVPFDAAIIDMHMPEMDGLALAAQIRRLRPSLPLILFGAFLSLLKIFNGKKQVSMFEMTKLVSKHLK